MYNILTLNSISEEGIRRLPAASYKVANDIIDPAGILVRSAKMHDMELGKSLEAVARAGAGVNNIPIEKLSERGVPVFNAPGANANAVKELGLYTEARRRWRCLIQGSRSWQEKVCGL